MSNQHTTNANSHPFSKAKTSTPIDAETTSVFLDGATVSDTTSSSKSATTPEFSAPRRSSEPDLNLFDAVRPAADDEAERSGAGRRRARHLVVVRESDEQRLEMFNTMRELTYLSLRDEAAAEAIRKVGMRPWDGDSFTVEWEVYGELVTRTVEVTTLRHGNTKAILFHFGGFWHLWSMSSAAKVSEAGYNNFTHLLIEQLQRLRPEAVYVANLSRLIRNEREASRLAERGFRDNVDRVVASDMTFELVGPNAWVGFMMLTVLGWCAATERTAIVQRLLAGRIAQWRRNEWPLGGAVVPFGYTYDKKLKRLVPDESKRDAVREMMIILSSDAPPSLKARQLDKIGVRAFKKSARSDRYIPFSARTNPSQAVQILMQWAPVWVAGEYLHRYTNALGDLHELSGLSVVRHPGDETDSGEFQMLFKVGVPEGGWCENDLLDMFARKAMEHTSEMLGTDRYTRSRPLSELTAVMASKPDLLRGLLSPETRARVDKATKSRRHASRARKKIHPLLGRNWILGDWFYELQASGTHRYRIMRWPLASMNPEVDREIRNHHEKGDL